MGNLYKAIFDKSTLGYAQHAMSYDNNGKAVDFTFDEVNNAFERITNVSRNDLIGKNRKQIFKNNMNAVLKSMYLNIDIKSGNHEYNVYCEENNRWYIVRVVFLDREHFITEIQYNLERNGFEIAEKEELIDYEIYRILVENATDVIYMYNMTNSTLNYISPSIFQLTGFTVEEYLRQKIEESINEVFIEPLKSFVERTVEYFKNNNNTNISNVIEYKQRCKNLEDIWVELSIKYIYNSVGEIEAIGVVRKIEEKKQNENMLMQSEDRFKTLFDNALVGYQSLDIDGNFLAVNNQWLDMMGYEREEVIGKWFGDFIVLENQNSFKDSFSIFKAQGYIHSEFEAIKKNGEKIFIAFDGKIGKHKNGEFKQTHCVLKDISIQRQLEDELAKNRELMKSLMDNTTDSIYIKDTTGKYLVFNSAAEKVVGKSAKDVLGADDTALFTLEEAKVVMAGDRKVLEERKTITYEEVAKDSLGVSCTFLSTKGPVFDKNNKLIGLFGITRDITERIKWEKDLFESEQKYRFITENVGDIISVYNFSKEQFMYISPSIEAWRGISLKKAMEEKFEDIVMPDFRERFKNEIKTNKNDFTNNISTKNLYTNEFQQLCTNGDRVWVEMSTKFQYNLQGEMEAVNISRNIEERKKAEEMMVRLSYNDQLTGLHNRRHYEEELKRLDIEKNLPLSLIMVDVNGLKLTNDAFGHREGDLLLKTIGKILKDACCHDEVVSRIGGDEFVILMKNSSAKKAKKIINTVNEAIENERNKKSFISLAVGYAIKEKPLEKMDDVFKEAEDDMYRHKLAEKLSMRSKTIDLIMNSLFEKSNREMLHSKRVSEICEQLATSMNFSKGDINQIKIAGLVHDIGKIGISNDILDKNEKLTEEELEKIKKHPEVGYKILSSVNEFSEIAKYVLCHQERWDGKGYPQALKGEEIPIQARIITVVDAFDAMTSDRTYRRGMDEESAIAEIKKFSGTQFDPEIAKIFIEEVISGWKVKNKT